MAYSQLLKHGAISILVLLVVGCSNQTAPTFVPSTPNPLRWLAKEGNPAPDFVLASLTGQTVDSSHYRGRPILVHFWATWCQPCRDEAKRLEVAKKAYRSKGFEILAITNETDRNEVAKFAREQDLSFPILFDPSNTVIDQYRVTGLPTSFLIDADGIIRKVVPGSFTSASLELELTQIFTPNSPKPFIPPTLTAAQPTQTLFATSVPAKNTATPRPTKTIQEITQGWTNTRYLDYAHLSRGMTCVACHGTNTPTALTAMQTCVDCHPTTVPTVVVNRRDSTPHNAHVGFLNCTQCHHGHGPFELYCNRCHGSMQSTRFQ